MRDHCAHRSAGASQSCRNARATSITGGRRGFISGLTSAGLGALAHSSWTKLGFSESDLHRITHDNALGLMPQLKRV